MAQRLTPYDIWGDWDLDRFVVEIARWRDTMRPPPDVFRRVDRWWRRLGQPTERTGAVRVSHENDPEGNLWWMWVPDAEWIDEEAGGFRVQCLFRVHEREKPPRLECDGFRTVRAY